MSRPRFKIRELSLVGVPCIALVGGAAFLSRLQAIRESDQSGPYRAKITRLEVLPVSPFEAWQGFDTKIVVHASEFGQIDAPAGSRLSVMGSLRQKLVLSGQIRGQKKSFSVSSPSWGSTYEPESGGVLRAVPAQIHSKQHKNSLTFLASTSRFDPKFPIQLRGDIWFERTATPHSVPIVAPAGWKSHLPSGRLAFLTTQSHAALLVQPLERVVSANVNRVPFPVAQTHFELLSPSYAHTNRVGDERSGYVAVFFKPSPEFKALARISRLCCTRVRVFDARGVEVPLTDWHGRPVSPKAEWSTMGGRDVALIKLPIESVPLWHGQLTLKMWLAVGDNWPMKIQTIVRPAWMSRLPQKLQLQSVQVKKDGVIVRARYTGGQLLEWGNGRSEWGREMLGFFDSRQRVTPFLPPQQAGTDRFFPFWSQHFTMPNGKSYWLRSNVDLASVSCDLSNNCRFVYRTSAFQSLKPGQSAQFSVQIGVEGDGFLPIQATITRPKK